MVLSILVQRHHLQQRKQDHNFQILHHYIIMQQSYTIQRINNKTIVHPIEHRHTLIWIHGLAEHNEKNMNDVITALGQHIKNVKIIFPQAPKRFITVSQDQRFSWFDIKFRSEKSFTVPFNEAFNSDQVHDSFEKVLRPIIEEQSKLLQGKNGKVIVSGFSQGCGMSLHCMYSLPHLIHAAIGISGYFFPFTKYDPKLANFVHIIYGLDDDLRPWQYSKVTYYGRIGQQKITLIPKMKHHLNKNAVKQLKAKLSLILQNTNPKL